MKKILLGEIVSVHGIKGEVVVRSYAAAPADIAAYGPLTDQTGARTFTLEVRRVTDKGVIALVDGVADRTAAEKLRGTKLYVSRERLPAAEAGAFYHTDLIGLAAVDAAGATVGTIAAVHNFGAGDILEIQLRGSKETELVPFTNATVPDVDIAAGRIVVVMPSDAADGNA